MSKAMGGPDALFAVHDHTRTSPGPIGRPSVDRYAWNVAFAVPSGVSPSRPFVETMLLPGPWAATVGARAAAQTSSVPRRTPRRVNSPRQDDMERRDQIEAVGADEPRLDAPGSGLREGEGRDEEGVPVGAVG